MVIILLFGLVQSLFFGIIVLARKRKDWGDYLLAFLFLILAYEFWANWIFITGRLAYFPHLFGTALPLVLLLGPLLFFYIKIHITSGFYFKAKYLWHFLLYLMVNIIYLPVLRMDGDEKIEEYYALVEGKPSMLLSVVLLLTSLSPLIYTIWSLMVLQKHRKQIPEWYSYTDEKMKLGWLWYLTWSMFIVSTITLVLNAVIAFGDIVDWLQLRLYVLVISVIWVFSLGYYGIRRTPFFQAYPLTNSEGEEKDGEETGDDMDKEKYHKTRLPDSAYDELKDRLLDFMDREKPYLNKKLTIAQLAQQLDVPVHHLSQLLNEYLKQSFFEFINNYRIDEVKRRFADPESKNLTLIGMAMESGFSSKSSFIRIFKQFTDKTPSEYFKSVEVEN